MRISKDTESLRKASQAMMASVHATAATNRLSRRAMYAADQIDQLRSELKATQDDREALLSALIDFYGLHAQSDWRVPDEQYLVVTRAASAIESSIRRIEWHTETDGDVTGYRGPCLFSIHRTNPEEERDGWYWNLSGPGSRQVSGFESAKEAAIERLVSALRERITTEGRI